MRRLNTIVAFLLTASMAVLPMSMARAAALGGYSHATAPSGHHGHDHGAATHSRDDGHHHAAVDHASAGADHATPHDEASNASGAPSCCHIACHVFQVSAAPTVSTALGSAHVIQVPADEQVRGRDGPRIERPPRPV